jgi:hypothetical protein
MIGRTLTGRRSSEPSICSWREAALRHFTVGHAHGARCEVSSRPAPVLQRTAIQRLQPRGEYHDAAALHAVSRVGGALTESERLHLLDAVETLRRDDADVTKHVVLARDAMNQLGIRTKDWRRPAGAMVSLREPGRVVDQLADLPMARACLPGLKTALEAIP